MAKIIIGGETFEYDGRQQPVSEALAIEELYGKNYVQWQDYGFFVSRKYAVDMTDAEADAFQRDKAIDLRTELEPLADAEYQHLMEARETISNEGNNTDV